MDTASVQFWGALSRPLKPFGGGGTSVVEQVRRPIRGVCIKTCILFGVEKNDGRHSSLLVFKLKTVDLAGSRTLRLCKLVQEHSNHDGRPVRANRSVCAVTRRHVGASLIPRSEAVEDVLWETGREASRPMSHAPLPQAFSDFSLHPPPAPTTPHVETGGG